MRGVLFIAGIVLLLALPVSVPATDNGAILFLWKDAEIVDLLSPSLADSLKFIPAGDFAVSPAGTVLLLERDGNVLDLSRRARLPAKTPLGVESITHSSGLLIAVRKGRIGYYEDGEIVERVELPAPGMRIAAGRGERLYAFGPMGKGSSVFLLEGGKTIRLFDLPGETITDLSSIGERIFFAAGNRIYTAARGEKTGLLFLAAGEDRVRSIAPDPRSGLLFFSAGDSIYALRAGFAIAILKGLSGYLRCGDGALYVLDPEKRRLVRVTGLEKIVLAGDAGGGASPLSPSDFKE